MGAWGANGLQGRMGHMGQTGEAQEMGMLTTIDLWLVSANGSTCTAHSNLG